MPGNLYNKGMVKGAGILGRSGIMASPLAQAQTDAAAYRALLASNGKTMQDAVYLQIVSFASQLYATAGRVDFLMLRSIQNMGSGSIAYSFHGKACTLVNGCTWGADGITMGTSAQISTPLPIPNYPSVGFTVQTFTGAVNQLHYGAYGSTGDRRMSIGGGAGLLIAGGNYGSNARVDYTHAADTLYATAWRMLGNVSSSSCTGGTSGGETVLVNGIDSAGLVNDYICGNDWNSYPADTITINKASNTANKTAFFMWAAGTADKSVIYSAYRRTIGSNLALPSSAVDDAEAYRSTLASAGKVLLDADYQQIVSFASQLYAAVGRQDFLMLRSSQNVGSGSTAYTFHGQPCTLVNGATWGSSGTTMPVNTNAKLSIPWAIPIAPAALFSVTSGMVVSGNTAAPVWLGGVWNGGQRGWQSITTGVMFACNGTRVNLYGVSNTFNTRLFQVIQPATDLASYTGYDGTTLITANDGNGTWDSLGVSVSSIFGDAPTTYPLAQVCSFLLPVGVDLRLRYSTIRTAYKSTIGSGLSLP